jgi:hypothetical protein
MVDVYDTDLRRFVNGKIHRLEENDETKLLRGKLLNYLSHQLFEVQELCVLLGLTGIDNSNLFRDILHLDDSVITQAEKLGVDLNSAKYEMDTYPMACHYGSGIPFYDDLSDLKAHDEWRLSQKRGQLYTVKINDLMGGGSD